MTMMKINSAWLDIEWLYRYCLIWLSQLSKITTED